MTALVVLALAIGDGIGYLLRAPGSVKDWDEIRNWATFVVVVLGFSVAAYELDLQRRQFAEQARRSQQRDELLDGQLRELQQREMLGARMQADAVDFDQWSAVVIRIMSDADLLVPPVTMSVENKSKRPIRDVVVRLLQENGTALAADRVGSMLYPTADRPYQQRLVNPARQDREPLIRAGERYGFTFPDARLGDVTATYLARFTDDATLHWQVDHNLRLMNLESRDDW